MKNFSMKFDTSKGGLGWKHTVVVRIVMSGSEKWTQNNEIVVCGA